VTCVITRNNYRDIGEIYNTLVDMDIESLFFQPAYIPHDDGSLSVTDLPHAEKSELVEALEPWAEEFGFERNLEILTDSLLYGEIPEERCVMGESRFVVYHDGRVQPCFDRPDLAAGNVTEEDPVAVLDRVVEQGGTIRNRECFNSSCVCFFE
jgi:MoaA/NifB/PqqE/SkfB family radical SAM enzyme